MCSTDAAALEQTNRAHRYFPTRRQAVTEDRDLPAVLDTAFAAIGDGVFALVHLIVEQRAKAY